MKRSANIVRWLALAGVLASSAAHAVTVPGTSDFKLAGMPNGTTASSGDVAPGQSPVLALDGLAAGTWLTFSVTTLELVGNCAGCTAPTPDGGGVTGNTPEHGISSLNAPINSLVGVFLGADAPDGSAAPVTLDFSSPASRDFGTLAPELKQSFFIGDGQTSGGLVQSFLVPAGATRLFLGTQDGYGWYNNVGAYEVSITAVPEPASFALLSGGLLALALARKKKGQPV